MSNGINKILLFPINPNFFFHYSTKKMAKSKILTKKRYQKIKEEVERSKVKLEKSNKVITIRKTNKPTWKLSAKQALETVNDKKKQNMADALVLAEQLLPSIYREISRLANKEETRSLLSLLEPKTMNNMALKNAIVKDLREQGYNVEKDNNPYVRWD